MNVRKALTQEGMLFDLDEAIDRYPAFKEMTFDVVLRERNSVMAPESAKKVREYQKEHTVANERDYFYGIVPKVVKDGRLVPGHKAKLPQRDSDKPLDAEFDGERDGTLQRDIQPAYMAFEQSGMDVTQDQKFVEGLLPILEKDFGLLTPKPDFVFGFKFDESSVYPVRTVPRISHHALQLIRVAPPIEHPFFVIEGKGGNNSPIQEAENQAIRSGAALVNARKLLERKACSAMQGDPPGPDMTSWVFSCAWVPHFAQIFVNWLEFNAYGEPYYHMNLIESYVMNREGEIQAFRRAIHNILDWGLQPARKQALDELVVAIAAAEEAAKEDKKAAEEVAREDKKAEAKRQRAAKKAGKEA